VLRVALREHYGISSEKLAEFGVRPFRGRNRKVAPIVVPPPEVKPAALPAAAPAESPDSES
jgi:hypothetical protein